MSIIYFISVITCCSLMFLTIVRKPFDAPFLFVIHIGLLMSFPPLMHALGYEYPFNIYTLTDPLNTNIKLSLILILFTIGVIIGFRVFKNVRYGLGVLPNYDYDRSDRMTWLGILVLTGLSFMVIIFPIAAAGFNIAKAITSIRFDGYFYGGLNILRQFTFFAAVISGAFMVYLLKHYREKTKPVSKASVYTMIAIFCMNILFSVILGGKTFTVFPLSAALIANEICRKRIRYNRILMGFMIIAIVVVGLQFLRTKILTNMDLSNLDRVYSGLYFVIYDASLLYVEANDTYLETKLGEDFGNSFIAIVPRALWPDKPNAAISAGNRFARAIEPNHENPGGKPPYGLAQWYVNFGWIGTFIGGCLTGLFLALIQRRYGDFRENPFSFVITWHLIFLVLGPWPGGIHNTSLLNYTIYIFPLFIFKWLTQRKLYKTSNEA